jgi:hypothetical protein
VRCARHQQYFQGECSGLAKFYPVSLHHFAVNITVYHFILKYVCSCYSSPKNCMLYVSILLHWLFIYFSNFHKCLIGCMVTAKLTYFIHLLLLLIEQCFSHKWPSSGILYMLLSFKLFHCSTN